MPHPYDYQYDSGGSEKSSFWHIVGSLIPGAILLMFMPPVGVIVLIFKLKRLFEEGAFRNVRRHPEDLYNQASNGWQDMRGRAEQFRQDNMPGSSRGNGNAEGYTPKTGAYSYRYRDSAQNGQWSEPAQHDQRMERERRRQEERMERDRRRQEEQKTRQQQQQRGQQRQEPQEARYATRVPYSFGKVKKPKKGTALTITGCVLAACFAVPTISFLFDFLRFMDLSSLFDFLMMGAFTGASMIAAWLGMHKSKNAKRYNRYLVLVGRNTQVPLAGLFEAMGVTYRQGCQDLQDMLDHGYLPTGYLDMGRGMLVFGTEGMQFDSFRDFAKESAEQTKESEEEVQAELDEYAKQLVKIRQLNDSIAHVEMSEKIYHIEDITRRIFDYVKTYPEKKGQLTHFFNYYLPTTINLLERYAQLEAQKMEGENISAAKARIEGMMDMVLAGFEKQLDQLFAGTAMDISAEVQVLEQMLQKDGLSNNSSGFQMEL